MSQHLSQRLATRSAAKHSDESDATSDDQQLTKTQKATRTRKANQEAVRKRNEEIAHETRSKRASMQKALDNAGWFEAAGRKRPKASRPRENSDHEDNGNEGPKAKQAKIGPPRRASSRAASSHTPSRAPPPTAQRRAVSQTTRSAVTAFQADDANFRRGEPQRPSRPTSAAQASSRPSPRPRSAPVPSTSQPTSSKQPASQGKGKSIPKTPNTRAKTRLSAVEEDEEREEIEDADNNRGANRRQARNADHEHDDRGTSRRGRRGARNADNDEHDNNEHDDDEHNNDTDRRGARDHDLDEDDEYEDDERGRNTERTERDNEVGDGDEDEGAMEQEYPRVLQSPEWDDDDDDDNVDEDVRHRKGKGRKRPLQVEKLQAEEPQWDDDVPEPSGDRRQRRRGRRRDQDVVAEAASPARRPQHRTHARATDVAPSPTVLRKSPNGNILLQLLHPTLRKVIKACIVEIYHDLVFINGFDGSNPDTKDIYYRQVVATNSKDYPEIIETIDLDFEFRAGIYRLLETRLCNYRKALKDEVEAAVPASYNLKPDADDFKDRIEGLKANSSFIYPGDVMASGVLNRRAGYQHPIFAQVARRFLFRRNRKATSNILMYFINTSGGDQWESIPTALIALIATAIYAVLIDTQAESEKPLAFETDYFLDSFLSHMGTLHHLEISHPVTYRKFTTEMWKNTICGIPPKNQQAQSKGVKIILSGMDLEGLE